LSFVLDASVTLAWIYSVETTPGVTDLLDRLVEQGAVVPSLWHLEIANALEMGVRRGRCQPELRDAALADLLQLPITVDSETPLRAFSATAKLAAHHRLTVYGAAYLELARRLGVPLATLDGELRNAAAVEGVILLGE
jgi:predicted nucleic acid-binding protein